MSNHLAIATVTAVLRELLVSATDNAVTGADVNHIRPDTADAADAAINICLYHVRPNLALSNADLPTRRPDGSLAQRPVLALDLHYLLTFYGEDADLVPQRLMGAAMRELHTKPVLTRAAIEEALDVAVGGDPTHPLANSNLAEQVELVRFTPLSLDLEALSKLWSVFFQTPYSLSVAYRASVVLIEPEETPTVALPVQSRGVYVAPFSSPTIHRVASTDGPFAPITTDSTLAVTGSRLVADVTRVRLGGVEIEPEIVSADELHVDLTSAPSGALRSGAQGIHVVHKLLDDSGQPLAFDFESNVGSFVLRPTATLPTAPADAPTQTKVVVEVTPPIRVDQKARLILNGVGGSFQFESAPIKADVSKLEVAIHDVPTGSYFVRVSVDGAESLLTMTAGVFDGPEVTIP